MLTTIGQPPEIISAVPAFPARGLPGGVRPDLWVSLAGLAKPRVHDLFMQIEYPEYPVDDDPPPPPPPEGDYATIGAFYDAITSAFRHAHPSIDGENQLTHATFDNFGCIGATVGGPETPPQLTSQSHVLTAMRRSRNRARARRPGPMRLDYRHELAHYYKFGSILHEALYVPGHGYTGEPIPFPEVAPMQEAPRGRLLGSADGGQASPGGLQRRILVGRGRFRRSMEDRGKLSASTPQLARCSPTSDDSRRRSTR